MISSAFCYVEDMKRARFEWDEAKDEENQRKHGVSFAMAQQAFLDPASVLLPRIRAIALKRSDTTVSGKSHAAS